MQFVRGNPQDFDDIEYQGNPGWGYKDMLHYFKKMENYIAGPIVDEGEDNGNDENASRCRNLEAEVDRCRIEGNRGPVAEDRCRSPEAEADRCREEASRGLVEEDRCRNLEADVDRCRSEITREEADANDCSILEDGVERCKSENEGDERCRNLESDLTRCRDQINRGGGDNIRCRNLENEVQLCRSGERGDSSGNRGQDNRVDRNSDRNDRITGQNQPVSSKYHAKGGPQKNGRFPIDPFSFGLQKAIEKAFDRVKIPHNPDYNGKSQMGYTQLTGAIDEIGYRYNIAKAYLTKIPRNLKVCRHATATRILFKGKQADGIEFMYNNGNVTKLLQGRKAKEYIVSGGPYNSPALLERSGIGRKEVLENAGVKPVHILPGVGENLEDHYITLSSSFKVDPKTASIKNPVSLGIAALGAFLNTSDPFATVPDTQFLFTFFGNTGAFGNIKPSIAKAYKNAGTVLVGGVIILREKTPGSTHITQATDPFRGHVVVEKAYETREDVKTTVRGITLLRDILLSPPLEEFNIELFVLPQCRKFPLFTEQEIMCGCKLLTRPIYHATGTCSMGPSSDHMAVVDSRLRVHGVKGLRVVDSSILPLIPRGNTQVPTMAVGEKGADLIKEDWGQLSTK